MSKNFLTERDGQVQFFIDFNINETVLLANNTDGVYRGTLFEFKLNISDINKVLFQAIKYLSHMRLRGEPVPAQILLVALNQEKAYLFNSDKFLPDIEEIYAGAASKNNVNFRAKTGHEKIDFSKSAGKQRIAEILNNQNYTQVHIDVFDVAGWAERFYRENPSASKINLFKELREPQHLKKYILPPDKDCKYSWSGDEADFTYIMDLLNDNQHKKELGAFYTPKAYCRKATELVRRAIKQVPAGNNYIILDRSAGTGNLEEFLTNKPVNDIVIGELDRYIDKSFITEYLQDKASVISTFYSGRFDDITIGELEKYKTSMSLHDHLSDNEIGHVIVNTYELKEWIVLEKRFGDLVELIIPPPEEIDNTESLVEGADALSAQFVTGQRSINMTSEYHSSINRLLDYVKDKKTNIILYENPPYSDTSADKVRRDGVTRDVKKNSFVAKDFKSSFRSDVKGMIPSKELANLFIWSGWKYYLTKPNDAFVLFSPIKYWKTHGLGEHRFVDGFLFNRAHFHAGPSAISCILWQNEYESREELMLKAFDIDTSRINQLDGNEDLIFIKDIPVKKVHKTFNEFYFDKRIFGDDTRDGIYCDMSGLEANKTNATSTEKIFNKNILGYEYLVGYTFGAPKQALVRTTLNARKNGFYLRSDNFIDKLPLFAAKLYPQKNWYERDVYFTTADGGNRYLDDKDFLKSCFIFTCLTQKNHCRSIEGSDGRFYKNELCFDGDTVSKRNLASFKLNKDDRELLDIFEEVIKEAKVTANYDKKNRYGTYQIDQELNTRYKDENDAWVYDYEELNTAINTLKTKLALYYETFIQPKLFEYELLK